MNDEPAETAVESNDEWRDGFEHRDTVEPEVSA